MITPDELEHALLESDKSLNEQRVKEYVKTIIGSKKQLDFNEFVGSSILF